MTPYNSDETPHLYELTLDQTVTAGSFIAALDDDEDKLYHIAEVISVINEQIKVHYWGNNIAQAKWEPLWFVQGTNKVSRIKPKTTKR